MVQASDDWILTRTGNIVFNRQDLRLIQTTDSNQVNILQSRLSSYIAHQQIMFFPGTP